MNKFDLNFFAKYVPEGQELITVIHTHPIIILGSIFIKMSLFVVLPSFFYYYSVLVQDLIPFLFLEGFLIIMFIKIIYDIFNWYNDVWIVTNSGVIWLERSLLKTNTDSIDFDNIEGIGVEQEGIWDKILKKGDLVIHKVGDDSFVLEDAINPFKAVDILEVVSEEQNNFEHEHDDRFDNIMDALGGVVENYLEKQGEKDEVEMKKERIISKAKSSEGTIDLR